MILSGSSTKKYLGTLLRTFLFMAYKVSIGIVTLVCRIPRFRMNCLIAFSEIPRSRRDWSDHVRGSFHPWYTFDLTSFAPFDFDILTPSIEKWPL